MAVRTTGCSEHFLDPDDITDDELSKIFLNTGSFPIISCEDIWKNLGFPPTPPRSPVQSFGEYSKECLCIVDSKRSEFALPYSCLSCSSSEQLQEKIISFDLDGICPSDCVLLNQINALKSLRSNLIHDCMWNGSNTMDRKVKEKRHAHLEDHIYDTPCPSPAPTGYSSNDCVDPSAVFPFPLTDCSSGSQSESEEEIDVVTVDKPSLKRSLSDSLVIFDGVSEVPQLKRTRSSPSPQPAEPKTKFCNQVKKIKKPERRHFEELDPEQRRATHNVLERKRRNDLKYSFSSLRNSIPALKQLDKTPKVTILRKAADYVNELKKEEEKLNKEKETLTKDQRNLLDKFVRLSKLSTKDLKKKLPDIVVS